MNSENIVMDLIMPMVLVVMVACAAALTATSVYLVATGQHCEKSTQAGEN
jgi:hypothetical protein